MAVKRLGRRQFVVGTGAAGLGLLAGCGRLPWQAPSPSEKIPRLGLLRTPSPETDTLLEPFRQGLREHGLVEGQNILLEYRYAHDRPERLPSLAAELVSAQVDLIVTSGAQAVSVAKQATSTLPIVMLAASDPVGAGLTAGLARPGGNVTGMTESAPGLPGKLLELLRDVKPGTSRVAVLWTPADGATNPVFADTQVAAQELGVEVQSLPVRSLSELEACFEAIVREQAAAIDILGAALLTQGLKRIADFALQHRLPSIYPRREFAQAGGLLAYGPNFADMARRAAYYVDKILKGAKPADLPVEQPMLFDFAVNMKTARALGLTFPPEIMLQVTEVIE
jgi:putative tryptophan/tyrosine transport system substrate-binding protein